MSGGRAARPVGLAAGAVMVLSGCFGPVPEAPRATARPAVRQVAADRPAAREYVVQRGDTFRAIAARLGVDMRDLGAVNGIPSPYVVRIGQVLRVPLPRRPEPGLVARPPVARPAPSPPGPATDAPRLIWPTDGAVATGFGATVRGRPNRGIDLVAYRGLAVRAAAAGRVIFAGQEPERFGQLVVIDHGGGWTTAYAYLGEVTVREGEAVRQGERIARVGESGAAHSPTLHFELRRDNVPVDPARVLPQRF